MSMDATKRVQTREELRFSVDLDMEECQPWQERRGARVDHRLTDIHSLRCL